MKDLKFLSLYLSESLVGYFNSIIIKDRYLICTIDKKNLLFVLNFLKKNNLLKFRSLLDIFGIDFITRSARFEVNYLLLSIKYNVRILIKVNVKEQEAIPSVMSIYSSAGWLEREVWDMYGVFFIDHLDLRRILTDYGFEGHPLRKDFPLSGYKEVRYDDGEKRVLQESMELLQEYKYYNFMSPWIID